MRIPVVLAGTLAIAFSIGLTVPTAAAETGAVNPMLLKEQLRPDEIRFMQQRLADWPQLQHCRGCQRATAQAAPGQPRVFFGDSITEGWGREGSAASRQGLAQPRYQRPDHGTDAGALPAGRAGAEATGGVILAGTNDAGNTGPSTQAMIEDNLHAMVDLARAHGIAVVLASCRSAITHGCPGSRLRLLCVR